MNLFRKMLWKLNKKNIFLITCPTRETQGELMNLKIIKNDKIIYLPDPIIEIDKIIRDKKKEIKEVNLEKKVFCLYRKIYKAKKIICY